MRNLICAVTILAVSTAQADTILVDANCPGGDGSELDPYCSIQTAIDNAVDTDEIIVAPGTYFETINFLGKAITLARNALGIMKLKKMPGNTTRQWPMIRRKSI